MRPDSTREIVVLLVLVFAGADVLIPKILDTVEFGGTAAFAGVLLGFVVGQVYLIGIWAASAVGPPVVRVPTALLAALAMYIAFLIGIYWVGFNYASEISVLLGIVLMGCLLGSQIPLWILAQLFGWRLVSAAQVDSEWELTAGQFNIKHLLIGMAIVAMALALVRAVLPIDMVARELAQFVATMSVPAAVMVAFSLAIVLPCIWGVFQSRERLEILLLFGAILLSWVTFVELIVLVNIAGYPGELSEMLFGLLALNFSQCLTVAGPMRLLRGVGYQLVRRNTAKNDAAPPSRNEQ